MSFLDIDERILGLAEKIDLVISPVVDPKVFPESVDVTLVEGAVSNAEDVHRAKLVRERSKFVISFGDCAVTGNVPAMRNTYDVNALFERAYVENATFPPTAAERRAKRPVRMLPPLQPRARPVHEIIKVDLFFQDVPRPRTPSTSSSPSCLRGASPTRAS